MSALATCAHGVKLPQIGPRSVLRDGKADRHRAIRSVRRNASPDGLGNGGYADLA